MSSYPTIRQVVKGTQLGGDQKLLRIIDRSNPKGICFTVAIDNVCQGNYPDLEKAISRFEDLRSRHGFV